MLLVLLSAAEEEREIDGIVLERPVPSGEHRYMQPDEHCNNIYNGVMILLAHGVGCSSDCPGQTRKAHLE